MARPVNPKLPEIALRWRAGEKLSELAREYKIDKGYLSRYLHNAKINRDEQAKEAAEYLNKGYQKLGSLLGLNEAGVNVALSDKSTKGDKATAEVMPPIRGVGAVDMKQERAQIIAAHSESIALANEVMEIVKRANPQFAQGFQSLSALMIKRSREILESPGVTSADILNIARAVSGMNDTLGVFPKMPTIAQQINIGQKGGASGDQKAIDLKLEFIDGSGGKKPEKP